ncbi:hypothetical protein [Flaviflexus equikiangi]|uniref:hypothetical protein n=1 Tax=Flaviflexus equikiangi TaxID=2758573 RepID=UPI0015F61A0F|nr:hypothetical protein [Flaviflexus equikiangi]
MSNTYTLPLTPGQLRGYLENGLDYVSGLAVDSEDIDEITEIADLIELFQIGFTDSPYKADEPFYVLELVAGPLVQSRHAVGPLDPRAFLGGIFEVLPFDATGVAKAAGIETDLLWIEPTRVTEGSSIWKFEPGQSEPDMVAAYHGIAYGWETENGFKAIVPTNFLGTVIKRSWGEIPCDVELEDGKPVAVTMVSPAAPTVENGFEQIDSGLFAKRIAYTDDMEIYEAQKIAKVDGVPSRVLRPIRRDGEMLLEVQSLLPDAPYTRANGFSRYAPTVFVKAVPLEGVQAQARVATPKTWVIDEIQPATPSDLMGKDLTDTKSLIPDIYRLLVNAVPAGFTSITMFMQVVGNHFVFHAEYSKDGESTRITSIPTAIVHYTRQLKKNTYSKEDGGFFIAKFVFDATGTGNFGFNKSDKPMWAAQVPVDEWERDLAEFPRPGSATPDWLLDARLGRLAAAQPVTPETSEGAASGRPAEPTQEASSGAENTEEDDFDTTQGYIHRHRR